MESQTTILKRPIDYYRGLNLEDRIICRNVVFFERHTKETLRKKSLRSRLHHRYVLVRVLETSGAINIDGFRYLLSGGDTVLISPFQFHHYSELDSDRLRWQFITFELTQGSDRIRRMNTPFVRLDTGTSGLWDSFIETWENSDEASRLEALPILDRLLMRTSFAATRQTSAKPMNQRESPWEPRAESMIIHSIREGGIPDSVPRRLNISDRQFRGRFKEALEISPNEYRKRYQLHSAISLMQDEKLKLSTIAEMSGFNSQPAFTRFIKKLTGASPKQLREQIQQGAPVA